MSPNITHRLASALTLLLAMMIWPATGRCLAQEDVPVEIVRDQEGQEQEQKQEGHDQPAAEPQEGIQAGVVMDVQIVEGPAEGMDAQVVEVLVDEGEAEAAVLMGGMGGDFGGDEGDPLFIVLSRYTHAETGLARRACDLSPEQIVQLKKLNAQWIRDQIENKQRAGNINIMRGIGRFLGGAVINDVPMQDQSASYKRIIKLVDEQVGSILTEEQRQAFNAEREARDSFYREATAEVLVAVYDDHVFVKSEQRGPLVADIAKWAGSKNLYWQFYFQNDAYLPSVPNSVLAKTLSDEQLKSLKGLNSYSYEMDEVQMQMNGMRPGIEFIDD